MQHADRWRLHLRRRPAHVISVISAGITQGITQLPGLESLNKVSPGFNFATAARAGIGSVVNQGVNILAGRQNKFDWKGVAAAAIAAPVAAGFSNVVSGSADFNGDGIKGVDPNKIDFAPRFAGNLAGGVAATVVRQVVYGGGKMNFAAVAADAFGNAVAQAMTTAASEAAQEQATQLSDWLQDKIAQNSVTATRTDVPVQDVGPQVTDNGVRFTSAEVEGVAENTDLDDRVFRDDGAGGVREITTEDRERDRLFQKQSDAVRANDVAEQRRAAAVAAAQRATTAGGIPLPRTDVVLASAGGISGTVTDAGPVGDDALQSAFTLTMTPQERARADQFDASIRQFKEGILDKIRDQTPTSILGRAGLSLLYAGVDVFAPNDSGDLILAAGGALGGALNRAGRILNEIEDLGAAISKTFRLGDDIVANTEATAASRIAQNQINGNAARDSIASRYPGSRTEVTLPTLQGDRRLDVLTSEGLAIESKVGRTSLTSDIRTQVLKDVELLNDPLSPVSSLRWEFSRSPVTGKVGPTPSLEQFLRQQGIEIVINH